jgi:hypothetical protein
MGEAHKSSVDMAALEQALSINDLSAEERQDAAPEWLSAQQIRFSYTAKKGRLHANTWWVGPRLRPRCFYRC